MRPPEPSHAAAPDPAAALRVGLLLPRRGPAALWRLGAEGCALLAAEGIDAAGGVDGRRVEIVQADCGAEPEAAAAAARMLVERAGVEAIVGMQLSHQRNAVVRALAGRVPYVFTPHYEGGWCGPGAAPLGLGDAEALHPALAWLATRAGVRRVFFVGNDYVWPRAAHGATREAVRAAGATFAGATLLPMGGCDLGPVMAGIAAARPDLVVTVLIGEEAVRFHRAFAEAGLAPRVARLALGFDETLLWAVGPGRAEGLYTVQPFLHRGEAGPRAAMLDAYEARFAGRRPPVTALALGCFDGVRLAALLAGRAGAAARARLVRRGLPRAAALDLLGAPDRRPDRPPAILAEVDGAQFRARATA